jgi:hypothetical protein
LLLGAILVLCGLFQQFDDEKHQTKPAVACPIDAIGASAYSNPSTEASEKYAQGRMPLGWHEFIKSMPPEGLAASPPWWWCLCCVLRLAWSSLCAVCKKIRENNPKVGLWV